MINKYLPLLYLQPPNPMRFPPSRPLPQFRRSDRGGSIKPASNPPQAHPGDPACPEGLTGPAGGRDLTRCSPGGRKAAQKSYPSPLGLFPRSPRGDDRLRPGLASPLLRAQPPRSIAPPSRRPPASTGPAATSQPPRPKPAKAGRLPGAGRGSAGGESSLSSRRALIALRENDGGA